MDDPVVAASAGSETETIGTDMQNPQRSSADEIAKFFDDIRSRQGIFNGQQSQQVTDGIDFSADENVKAAAEQYNCDYKPPITLNKQNVYSINELISISKQLPEGLVEEIVFTLPKKKFWRLNHKQPDHANQGKPMGHRGSNKGLNGSSNGKGFSGEDTNSLFEKKGNKGKYSRMANGKKNGKFVKHERSGFMEEKDINVNHDDLQALEEEFEPTGNSMADFESWKAKMKEMERRKKGLPPAESSGNSKPSLSATSSSISDFLGLNKIQNDTATNPAQPESIETEKSLDDEINNLNKDLHSDSGKGSYSRFSSFFTQSSSSSSLPTMRNSHDPENLANKNSHSNIGESTPNSRNPSVPGGSKLLSFFNKEAGTPKGSRNQASLNTEDVRQKPINSSVVPPSQPHGQVPPQPPIRLPEQQLQHRQHQQHHQQLQQQQQQQQQRVMPPPVIAPDQLQTNNAFFQNLLSKGELQNQKGTGPSGPPPGVMLPPPGGQSGIPLGQQPPRVSAQGGQPPAGMGMSAPFPMGMPPGPGAFPPGLAPGGQAGMPLGLQPPGTGSPAGKPRGSGGQPPMNDNHSNGAKGARNAGGANSRESGSRMQQTQQPPPPLQPGMVPPQFIPGMAPPGFPMMPPNFNPMYGPPQGGLMPPPAGQGFFPPMPPPSGNMNFNAFPMQPPVFNQQHQEANSTESKK
ncbi:hypothetical protein ZYGR_0Z00800 [Zygosaccharomyces rouxii]|uniref:ZYRO0G02024p n=2 Tax=Zygosaccharomyces rouxii TaxID=4956 RepID=C5DZ75_ZYGRC|nr:uncharacterized protein ZYRO0G02024g [Zygosaccharomyces rouxii]KAH9202156.1 hypothetical protein LQ764DRAFT_232326 [Zygosaccharomyces rouxii]GAV50657.1 hypothetical protein ZYGR_0Z00800 [Zygosaccharomyces rouxii]CAR29159.1 ZYRO0G02024p [Zygosaccharomyces rouxii]